MSLSFAEFMLVYSGGVLDGWNEYMNFGGLLKIVEFINENDKAK